MKIGIAGTPGDFYIELSQVYNGVGIRTDVGTFAICERDGGIEIRLGNGEWYRWVDQTGPVMLSKMRDNRNAHFKAKAAILRRQSLTCECCGEDIPVGHHYVSRREKTYCTEACAEADDD